MRGNGTAVLSAHLLALQGQRDKLQAIIDGKDVEQTVIVYGKLVTFRAPAPLNDRRIALELLTRVLAGADEGSTVT